MKTIRFSIKGLLIAVTMTALGLVALLNASPLWVSIIVSVTLFLFLTALLALACRPGPQRAFWIGFAIFGLGYFVFIHTPLGELYQSLLPTHAALNTLRSSVSREVEFEADAIPPGTPVNRYSGSTGKYFTLLPRRIYFDRIGHCLWAWLLGLIGGFLARHFYLAQERNQTPASS